MKLFNKFIVSCLFLGSSLLSAADFTISTYNCGGLSNHYDYLRGVAMQNLMQERYNAEPEQMALNEKIQKLALKILFSTDPQEQASAKQEWDQKGYQSLFEHLSAVPTEKNSPNAIWNQKVDEIITNYKIRPVVIKDEEVKQMLDDHLKDLSKNSEVKDTFILLEEVRATMAARAFKHHMKFDIICLQEADYLDPSMFPENYEVLLSESYHSINGIAWNKERFELVETIGDILGRAFAVKLSDRESGKTVLVVSGHISGCNPFKVENDPVTGVPDSARGDSELRTINELFDNQKADFKLIGMDSNVTSLHPRLNILKDAGYSIDYENYLEPTCTNPHQVLNTRIDWIALKSDGLASITNIPVLSIGLNNLQTNISDHKPVAAKIHY